MNANPLFKILPIFFIALLSQINPPFYQRKERILDSSRFQIAIIHVHAIPVFFTQSGHYPIFTIRNDVEPPKSNTHISKRNHSHTNIAHLKKRVNKLNFNPIFNINGITLAFTLFMNIILETFYECVHIEFIQISCTNRNPWINQKLKNEIKVRLYIKIN